MRSHRHDPRYAAAVISSHHLAFLCRVAEDSGANTTGWFAGSGLTRPQLDDPEQRVSYRQASSIIRYALCSGLRPDLGLEVGRRETPTAMGVVGLAMLTSRTLADAVQIFLENHLQTGSLMDPAIEVSGGEIALLALPRFPDPELLPFLCEEFFAAALAVVRGLVGDEFRPLRLELSYPAPAHARAYYSLAQCEIRFSMPRNRGLFEARWLGQALPTYHPVSAQQALAALRRPPSTASSAIPDDLVATVEGWLRERLPRRPRLRELAHHLGLGERSLRRRFAELGTSFQALHDGVRRERALGLLQTAEHKIADVSAALGFSDAREFRRAFKRWTGRTPQAVRGV